MMGKQKEYSFLVKLAAKMDSSATKEFNDFSKKFKNLEEGFF